MSASSSNSSSSSHARPQQPQNALLEQEAEAEMQQRKADIQVLYFKLIEKSHTAFLLENFTMKKGIKLTFLFLRIRGGGIRTHRQKSISLLLSQKCSNEKKKLAVADFHKKKSPLSKFHIKVFHLTTYKYAFTSIIYYLILSQLKTLSL